MKILNKFVWSSTEPQNKNDVWFDGSVFKLYNQGDWEAFTLDIETANEIKNLIEDSFSVYQKKLTAGSGIRIENNVISTKSIFQLVNELPNIGDTNTIYFVISSNEDDNKLTEWVYVGNSWEKLGEFKPEIDLSGYVEKEEGKGLSSNDFSSFYKRKLDSLTNFTETKEYTELTADVSNVQSDIANIKQVNNNQQEIIENLLETKVSNEILEEKLTKKQDVLVNKVNIKTVNGESLLGEGNLQIEVQENPYDDTELRRELSNKVDKVPGKGLSSCDFTSDYIDIIESHTKAISSNDDDISNLKNSKQDIIFDLDDIRSKANSALQEIPSEYVTEEELDAKGYLTSVPDEYITEDELSSAIATKADKDGTYPEMVVGYADNLLGVDDPEDARFTFRPTDGAGSIKDGKAKIDNIKGSTIVWNQLYEQKSDIVTESSGVTLTINGDGSFTLSGTNTSSSIIRFQISNRFSKVQGHRYILLGCPLGGSLSSYWLEDAWQGTFDLGVGKIFTASDSHNTRLTISIAAGYGIADSITFKKPFIADLTLMFGAGNEPTTYEEFVSMLPSGIDLDAYNEGEIISLNGKAIKTVGFNAWDEEWESGRYNPSSGQPTSEVGIRSKNKIRILGGQKYYCHCQGTAFALFYDSQDNLIQKVLNNNNYLSIANREFVAPINAVSMIFYVIEITSYNHDICINLVHSGYRNGEYEPYESSELALPILKYFPNGMNSVGDVKDEIVGDKVIQRVGVVDLLSVGNYHYTSDDRITCLINLDINTANITNNIAANIRCEKYATIPFNKVYLKNQGISINSYAEAFYLAIYDPQFTDVDSFKSAMQGVKLYYELAEPIITYLDEPLALTYDVWDFGTEELLSDVPTTPFNGSIIYEFNARDTIRANKNKQDELVSGTNIKTINGNSILGSGNIEIQGSEGGGLVGEVVSSTEPTDAFPQVLYIEQTLTEEQKSVARRNIGVSEAIEEAIAEIPAPKSDVFEAIYGETTFEEIVEANTAGKAVVCKSGVWVMRLTRVQPTQVQFQGSSYPNIQRLTCSDTNQWSSASFSAEHDLKNLDNGIVQIKVTNQTAEVATPAYVSDAIASAITNVLNEEV